jgi:urea transport system ATP-binding protein
MTQTSESTATATPPPMASSTTATGPLAATEPLLQAEKVDLYYGAAQALWSVSLNAEIGKVMALMGRNGVGKTSFLRAVVGEQPIGGGEIRLGGVTLGRMAPHERARMGIGYVPQGRDIFPLLTVKENLETGFAPLKRGERSIPPDVFELFPVLKSMLRRRGGDLSGGQQQQLAIARALVTRPRLLVLDEPTEGIQPSIIKDIGRAISWLRSRGTMAILLVEQYFDFVHELADNFAVMDRGQIVLSGSREELDPDKVRRHLTV